MCVVYKLRTPSVASRIRAGIVRVLGEDSDHQTTITIVKQLCYPIDAKIALESLEIMRAWCVIKE